MAQDEPRTAPAGRLRSAWYVLMGRRTTPQQIASEWLEYKQIFDDLMTRLGAQLARQAKNQREALKAQLGEIPVEPLAPAPMMDERSARKAELRARMGGNAGPHSRIIFPNVPSEEP